MTIKQGLVVILYFSELAFNDLLAQNYPLYFKSDSVIYYSEELLVSNRENALFYQKKDTISNGNFYQYYLSGELFAKGTIKNKLKEGECTTYYKDGKVKEKYSYEKDTLSGNYLAFFENGAIYQKGKYEPGIYKPIELYDSTGKLIFDKNGIYTNYYLDGQIRSKGEYLNSVKTGIWKEYSKTYKLRETGRYIAGKKDSTWVGHREDGKLYYKEVYTKSLEKNQVNEGISYDSAGISYKYTMIFSAPRFLKGDIKETISKELHYPKSLTKKGINGRVFVEFILEKDGSISNVNILKGIHPQLDQIALKAVSKLDSWEPAKLRGQPIRLKKIQPIKFSIPE